MRSFATDEGDEMEGRPCRIVFDRGDELNRFSRSARPMPDLAAGVVVRS